MPLGNDPRYHTAYTQVGSPAEQVSIRHDGHWLKRDCSGSRCLSRPSSRRSLVSARRQWRSQPPRPIGPHRLRLRYTPALCQVRVAKLWGPF